MKIVIVSLLLFILAQGKIIEFAESSIIMQKEKLDLTEETNIFNISDVASFSIISDVYYENFGQNYVSKYPGDVNGDGIDDILIANPFINTNSTSSGKIYLYYGGPQFLERQNNQSAPDVTFHGESSGCCAGESISIVGDINGDGLDDIVIGAPCQDYNGMMGKVYIFFGKVEGWNQNLSLDTADASYIPEGRDHYLGYGITGIGDVNSDGFNDFAVGAPAYGVSINDWRGKVYLVFGRSDGWSQNSPINSTSASFRGETNDENLGSNNFHAGDINGDGYSDIAVGSPFIDSWTGRIYLIFGKSGNWVQNGTIMDSDVIIKGVDSTDQMGRCISGGGDVDGDGLEDLLIGVKFDDELGGNSGKGYLFNGRASGWDNVNRIDDSDTEFYIDEGDWYVGASASLDCDINGDGLNDIFIGSSRGKLNEETYGLVHVIYGNLSGHGDNYNLSESDVIFRSEFKCDHLGSSMYTIGDATGSGVQGILISAPFNDEGQINAGKVYVVNGGSTPEPLEIYSIEVYADEKYEKPVDRVDLGDTLYVMITGLDCNNSRRDLATMDISVIGGSLWKRRVIIKETNENSGIFRGQFAVSGGLHYLDKLLISSKKDQTKNKTVSIDYPYRPISVNLIITYSDEECHTITDIADINETIFIEVKGIDANPIKKDFAFVNLTSNLTIFSPKLLILWETEMNSGVYRSSFLITNDLPLYDNLTFKSVRTPSIKTLVRIRTHVQIFPISPKMEIEEDAEYKVKYENIGWAEGVTWSFQTDLSWLSFEMETLVLSGLPTNKHVGKGTVWIELEDNFGHSDSHKFQIEVKNRIPSLEGEYAHETEQDAMYWVDYDSDDEGDGETTWHLWTNASWLSLDKYFGTLSGIPSNSDVGIFFVDITVKDGNGGENNTRFELLVTDRNDPPQIITTDILKVQQGDPYRRDYEVQDIDLNDHHTWLLKSSAKWLTINNFTGLLSGTPGPGDVGKVDVNVTVTDRRGLSDSHDFMLTVENVNDKPFFVDVPGDSAVYGGNWFIFDVNASDFDSEDELEYSLSSTPLTDMVIDKTTGYIKWKASLKWFENEPFDLIINLEVSDGDMIARHQFKLKIQVTLPPKSMIISPSDGYRLSYYSAVLEWNGEDPEGERITYDIFLSGTQVFVSSMKESALLISDYSNTSLALSELEPGKIYYWTVIPFDGGTYGICENGVYSFRLNSAPCVDPVDFQVGETGTEFRLLVHASDSDVEDISGLIYNLKQSPKGMTIDDTSGLIRWTPGSDQVGLHNIVVNVTDGIDDIEIFFTIEIEEGPERGGLPFVILIAAPCAVIISSSILILIISYRRKGTKSEEDSNQEVEEQVIGPSEEGPSPPLQCDVSLTPAEAHAHLGKGSKKISYEELYGTVPSSEYDDKVTTEELKDFISEQIKELEEMEVEE